MTPIRVLLVDDHILFREGLSGIISSQPDMEVIGEANDGLEAIVKAKQLKPDLILMDIQMPGVGGIEATYEIKAELPDVRIIMLTVREDDEKLFKAIQGGAQGYILKSIRSHEMLRMIRGAMEGQAALPPELAAHVLDEFRRISRKVPPDFDEQDVSLTPREKEVLSHVAMGDTDKEIADTLSISIYTVKSHIRNILAKLQVENRRQAAYLAKDKGWV